MSAAEQTKRRYALRKQLLVVGLAGAAMLVWVATTGLHAWPWGELGATPRIIPLAVGVAGMLLLLCVSWAWALLYRSRRCILAAILVTVMFALPTAWAARKIIRWRGYIWISDYLLESPVPLDRNRPLDVVFCFVDHFEPSGIWNTIDSFPLERRLSRLRRWELAYSEAIAGHFDSDGRPPQVTWFFPVGHSRPQVLAKLAEWPARGWGEIEYHLHHRCSWGGERVRAQIVKDLGDLRRAGACEAGYAFVHGVYGLAAGDPNVCQVVNELDILSETGCYADLTFP